MLKYLFRKLTSMLSNRVGAIGTSEDQTSVYRKDMYKAERGGEQEVPPMYPKIYNVIRGVKGAGDKHTQLLKAGPLTRHEADGQDIIFQSPIEGWTTRCKYWTYSDGLSFDPEAIEDTVKLGNMIKDLARTWGEEVRVAKEELAARAFNEGGDLLGDWVFNGTHVGETDSSGDLLYDSIPLFNLTGNARTSKGGVDTYYNADSALTSVTAANFATLYNLMTATNNRDEQDRVKANPVDTILTEVGSEYFEADKVINTERGLPGSQLNDKNPYYKLVKNIYAWDYLDQSAFYVGKAQHKDFQFHERLAPVIRFFRNENNQGYKASIRVRFGVFFRAGSWKAWGRGGGTYA